MWTIDGMQPIFGGPPVRARIEDFPVGGGTGGSIFRATSPDIAGTLCMKALPQLGAGAARSLAQFFKFLGIKEIDRSLAKDAVQGQLRSNLQAMRNFLPTHYKYCKVPGHDDFSMCLLRLWCTGKSLSDCMNDDAHPLNTDQRYRLEVAKQVCRVLVGLSVFGVTHLDCYPDNMFIDDSTGEPVVTPIDLEGVGFAPSAAAHEDDAVVRRYPTAFEKEDFWITPWWYPRAGARRWLKDAARWQLLMAVLGVMTRTPSAVFTWAPADWQIVNAITKEIRLRANRPSAYEVQQLTDLMQPSDQTSAMAFREDCFGSEELATHLREVIILGIIGPASGETRMFLTNEDLRELQSKITHVKVY